ncbi:hypothetical protein [Rubrobacter aplysinae]|uniref:hypothetical protein n=1 Tax=Rubrobacter aplysinae TaxID=909625 RepID=UPI00064BCC44|nr:hypothetical protein [Rubrobacter aplysinae]
MSGFKSLNAFAVLCAFVLATLLTADTALAQASPPDNTRDQYEEYGERPAPDSFQDLARLGIAGPEDFDYCDAAGCHILGPSGKEFFFCDPDWDCEYVLWESGMLDAGDFDYFEVQARDERYGEAGTCYVCGSKEACLNVASYECDASGNCMYYMAGKGGGLEDITGRQQAGGEDAVPDAGEDARRALEGFTRALQRAPGARMKTALATEKDVSSGAPPVSRAPSSPGGSDEAGAESAGAGIGAGPGDANGSDGGGGGAGTHSGGRDNRGSGDENDETPDGDAASAESSGSEDSDDSAAEGTGGTQAAEAAESTEISSEPLPYVALSVGVLVLVAGGVVAAARRLW